MTIAGRRFIPTDVAADVKTTQNLKNSIEFNSRHWGIGKGSYYSVLGRRYAFFYTKSHRVT